MRVKETSGGYLNKSPYSKQGHHLKPLALDHVQSDFEYLQVWRLHRLCEQLVLMFNSPHSNKKWGFVFRGNILCFSLCPLTATGHHWEESGSIFFTPSLQVLIYMNKIPPCAFYFSKSFMQKGFMRYKKSMRLT